MGEAGQFVKVERIEGEDRGHNNWIVKMHDGSVENVKTYGGGWANIVNQPYCPDAFFKDLQILCRGC